MEYSEYAVLVEVEDQHWWHGGMRAIAAALLDPLYRGHSVDILDAGCGIGGNVRFLQRYGHVTGVDLSPVAAQFGKDQISGAMVQGSVLELPFADASFDLVTSFDVLYHRDVPSEAQALSETQRVLRSDGWLLMRLPAYEFLRSKHDRAVHTRRRYTLRQVQELIETYGFAVERLSYVNSLLFPIPLAQRMLERLVPTLEQSDSDLVLPAPLLNEVLRWPLATEAAWLGHGGRFPVGLSIICLVRKRALG
ncbi:MAG: class I SAM-dependent methyltransferase [Chloroflexi bacterium AL-W]|nr:class I SAM-dependent methyltransferase [Chloroflexi bacterium AL-N1]NOK69308.1 class I SAM-dependent methyltransferase [Chloroflexi bacterium AL-N10]NOK76369.1 class I SAM-dependent methyltransferase [Chloroflexi bacterium AL-N5]NOK83486.1 class I SAM-dependent methyltransferase [Chloroflexi bacterium AL-W]NOK91146.1 class I SAM-dependent methyltransferase [Chloroflexi bacterium AL-N15]